MADYYPLLVKTLEGLSETGPDMREAVYDRARRALSIQLRQLDPPLSEADIDREGVSLERAITQIETRYAGPDNEKDAAAKRPAAAVAAPDFASAPPGPAAPAPSSPRQLAPAVSMRPAVQSSEPVASISDAAMAGGDAVPPVKEGASPALAIRKGGRKRSLALPLGFALLAIPVGVGAWLWRERPSPAVQDAAPPPSASATPDTKFGERVGNQRAASAPASPGGAATPQPAPRQSERVPASQAPAAPSTPAPEPALAVSQRAMLFEENPASPQQPKMATGRAIWRLDAVNGGQGLPLDTVVQARVDIQSPGFGLLLVIRRNLDPALPASHTIELSFTTPSGDPARIVRDVGLPQMRPEETIRGVAVAGLPVPVKENVFLIGLSDLKSDVEKNTELLVNRSWLELPLRFASGQKAVLLFEKGLSGDRIMADAFRQWTQSP